MCDVPVLGLETVLRQKPKLSRWTGFIFLLVASGFSMDHFGPGAGILTILILLMTIQSLIILCAPLGVLNRTTVFLVVVLGALLEKLI